MKPNGVILYEGPSQLDGQPIAVIAIASSDNAKTGNMVQVYILRRDIHPLDAVKVGADGSICGDCKHRGELPLLQSGFPPTDPPRRTFLESILGMIQQGQKVPARTMRQVRKRTCYVNLGQGASMVYAKYRRGGYPRFNPLVHGSLLLGKSIRFGAYGDPCAVPLEVWDSLAQLAARRRNGSPKITGYTHQWNDPRFQGYRAFLQASVDSATEYHEAKALGWNTFRAKPESSSRIAGERVCPASQEAGLRVHCEQCAACNGTKTGKDIVINLHGGVAVNSQFPLLFAILD